MMRSSAAVTIAVWSTTRSSTDTNAQESVHRATAPVCDGAAHVPLLRSWHERYGAELGT